MDEEDEAFEAIEKAQGWRKRQIEQQLGQPIYFKPRREWVSLSGEELEEIWGNTEGQADLREFCQYVDLIEAKLKEKNHV